MKINAQIKEELKKYLKEREQKEKEKVFIVSASKLTPEEKDLLFQKLPTLKKAEIIEHIDTDLIAGVIVKQGSRMHDFSLASMIRNLQHMTHEQA